MTARTFKRIEMLVKEGVPVRTGIELAINLSKNASEAADKIMLLMKDGEIYRKTAFEALGVKEEKHNGV